MKMNERFGLIGKTLKHSFSPQIHKAIGDYSYQLFELNEDDLARFLTEKDFAGINVTIPYKEKVIPFLDEIDPVANQIGAVNTIVNRDGKLYGYNTDADGFSAMLDRYGINLKDKKVLILGSGGTSKTAKAVAMQKEAAEILRVSRHPSAEDCISYEQAKMVHRDAEIIINTTPCGMFPDNDSVPIDLRYFENCSGVADVIYNPLKTALVRDAEEKKIPACNGLYMLVMQAIKASELFFDKKIPEDVVESVFQRILDLKRNWVLIGMPACGKTTVGKVLAKKTGRLFFDTDRMIEMKEGRSVSAIFATDGERYFRDAEKNAVREVSQHTGAIIATGGGVVLNKENIAALSQNGSIIFLDRPLSALMPTADRPTANSAEKIAERYDERYDLYCQAADLRIDASASVNAVVENIIDSMKLSDKKNIWVINGPNINMLGVREPEIYGKRTYSDLIKVVKSYGESVGADIHCFQSNHEGILIDIVQGAYGKADGIVINPGGYTHTSVALADAIRAVGIPTVEVHLSDLSQREDFRQISFVRSACVGTITGHGIDGYREAIELLIEKLKK